MSDILRNLSEASYEGVRFPVESAETQGGNDFAQHIAYRRRGADMEFTGLRAYSGSLTVLLMDTPALVSRYGPALTLRYDLQEKFETVPIGTLTHPTFGTFRAAITDWSEPLDAQVRSGTRWTVKWTEHNGEAGSLLTPDSPAAAPTAPDVAARADAADAAGSGVAGYRPAAPTVRAGLDELSGNAVAYTKAAMVVNAMLGAVAANLALPAMGRVGSYAALTSSLALRESVVALRGQYLPSATARYFTVPAGMALHDVARLVYGDPSRAPLLYGANSVADPLALAAGRVLVVPPVPA